MSRLIDEFAYNLKNFCLDNYNYSAYTDITYYEAVSWSGLMRIASTGLPNPVFTQNYPNQSERDNIDNITKVESGLDILGYSKLVENNCNN